MDATHLNRIDMVVLNDAPPELAVAVLDAETPLLIRDAESAHVFERDARLRLSDLAPFLERMRRIKVEAIVR